MKKNYLLVLIALFMFATQSFGQAKVTNEGFLQLDYPDNSDASLSFGGNPNASVERGRWAIEYWNDGLNFWIPWPNAGTSSYKIFLENTTGHVGINDGTPSYQLDVNGDIATYGTLRISSDERFKTNIKNINGASDKISLLNGVTYKMKETKKNEYIIDEIKDPLKIKTIEAELENYENNTKEVDRYGFIAQELKEVIPELVDEDDDGYYNIDYIGLIPILVESIKELNARIDDLERNCCDSSLDTKSAVISTGSNNTEEQKAELYQNQPNPFTDETIIRFEIPQEVSEAQLYICNMQGVLIKTIQVNQRGLGYVTINGNELGAGMYLYSLVNDRKVVDTKQMLLTK